MIYAGMPDREWHLCGRKGEQMNLSKDKKTGKWLCQFYYTDWQGNRKKKFKRGFRTKSEAEAWARDFLQ